MTTKVLRTHNDLKGAIKNIFVNNKHTHIDCVYGVYNFYRNMGKHIKHPI